MSESQCLFSLEVDMRFRVPAVLLVLSLMGFVCVAVAGMDAPKEPITIALPELLSKQTKTRVIFYHEKHSTVKCQGCHHTWDGASDVKTCASPGCHDDGATKKGERSYYRAFHSKSEVSCMGCHKAKKKAGEKYGFISCGKGKSCHPDK
jgi:hypothetical protein